MRHLIPQEVQNRMVNTFLLLILTTFCFSALAITPPTNWPKSISIAAATVGTANYALAAGMANLVSKYRGVRTVPEASSTGGRTLHQLNNKEVEFAL